MTKYQSFWTRFICSSNYHLKTDSVGFQVQRNLLFHFIAILFSIFFFLIIFIKSGFVIGLLLSINFKKMHYYILLLQHWCNLLLVCVQEQILYWWNIINRGIVFPSTLPSITKTLKFFCFLLFLKIIITLLIFIQI